MNRREREGMEGWMVVQLYGHLIRYLDKQVIVIEVGTGTGVDRFES